MPVVQKLLDRFTWNFHRKCKSIQPLCLWNIKAIGKTYKNSSSFNTLQWWNKAELKLVCGAITGYFWYFKIFELTMEIRCHSDKNFQYLHQRHQWSLPPPPFHILFLLLAIYQCLRVFQLTFWWILTCLRSPSALSFHCCKWNLYLASSMCMVTTVTMLGAVALVNSNSKTCPSSHIFQISRMICYNSNNIRLNFNISIDKRTNISHDKYAQLGTALSHCVKILL